MLKTLLVIRQKSRDPNLCEVIDFIISKLESFKNPFATIASFFEFGFRRRSILSVTTKKMISMSNGSSTSS